MTTTRPPTAQARPRNPAPAVPGRARAGGPTANPQDLRRTLLALLGSFFGVIPLCALFTDHGWLIDVALSMGVVVGPAAALRTRRPPSTSQVWLGIVALVPWLTLNFLRDSAWFGVIPTGGTWHQVGLLLADLHRTSTQEVAPVHTTVAVRLVLCTVLALVAALVDLIAVVGRRGALAGAPLLVIYAVAGAVPRKPVAWLEFAFAGAGFLILLALDSSDDFQRWGHRISAGHRGGVAGMRSAQRIGVAAVLAALIIPTLFPSSTHNALSDLFHDSGGASDFGASTGTGGAGIDPFATLRGQLIRDRTLTLFHVAITDTRPDGKPVRPFYVRENVLSQFTGKGWIEGGDHGRTVPVDAVGGDTSSEHRSVEFDAQVTIDELRSDPPVFADPLSVTGVASDVRWSPRDELLLGGHTQNGQVITERIIQPDPSIPSLRAAKLSAAGKSQWLRLPRISPYVTRLTSRLTASAQTEYDRAAAILGYFTDPAHGFAYSLQTSLGDSGDALVDFLKNRVGYCQQYAAALGVMFRLASIPARVVLGYAHSDPDNSGAFTVTTNDAHAWVEAYFAGVGWVPFDATPLAGFQDGSISQPAWSRHPESAGGRHDVVPTPSLRRSASTSASSQQPGTGLARSAQRQSGGSAFSPALLVSAGIVVLLVALAAAPSLIRLQRRRARFRAAEAGDVEAAWAELIDTARDVGLAWSSSRTARQIGEYLARRAGVGAGAVTILSRAVERARYARPRVIAESITQSVTDSSPQPITESRGGQATATRPTTAAADATGHDFVTALRSARSGLLAHASDEQRMRARWWPPSLRRRR